jgi:uncharacterized protein YkuJ
MDPCGEKIVEPIKRINFNKDGVKILGICFSQNEEFCKFNNLKNLKPSYRYSDMENAMPYTIWEGPSDTVLGMSVHS